MALGILFPQRGIEARSPAVQARSRNHGTSGECPSCRLFVRSKALLEQSRAGPVHRCSVVAPGSKGRVERFGQGVVPKVENTSYLALN